MLLFHISQGKKKEEEKEDMLTPPIRKINNIINKTLFQERDNRKEGMMMAWGHKH